MLLACAFAKAIVDKYFEFKLKKKEKKEGKTSESPSIVKCLGFLISVLLLPLLFMGGRKQAMKLWSQARQHLLYFTEAFSGLELVSGWLGIASDGLFGVLTSTVTSIGALLSRRPGYSEVKQGLSGILGEGDASDSDDEEVKNLHEPAFRNSVPSDIDEEEDEDSGIFPRSWFESDDEDLSYDELSARVARALNPLPVAQPVHNDHWFRKKLERFGSKFSVSVLGVLSFTKKHPKKLVFLLSIVVVLVVVYYLRRRGETKEARHTKTALLKRQAARKNQAYEDRCKKSGITKEQRKARARMWIDYDQFGNPILDAEESLYAYDEGENLLFAVADSGAPGDEFYDDPSDSYGGYGGTEAMQGGYHEFKDGVRFVVLKKKLGDCLVECKDKLMDLSKVPNAQFKRWKKNKAKVEKKEGKIEGCIHPHDCPLVLSGKIVTNSRFPCNVMCGGHHCVHFAECKPIMKADTLEGKKEETQKHIKRVDKKQRQKFWKSAEEKAAFKAAFAEAQKVTPNLTYGVFAASLEKKEAVVTINGEKKNPFFPSRIARSVGWATCVGEKNTNSMCANLCLNGVAVAYHIVKDAGKQIDFVFGECKFSIPVSSMILIARDTLWSPLPEFARSLSSFCLTNATKMVRAGENVLMVAYASAEAEQKGDWSSSESVVKKLEGCVDVLGAPFNERATYTSASVSGNCTGPVVNSNHQIVGWHNATDGVHNFFIPITSRCLELTGKTAPQSFQ